MRNNPKFTADELETIEEARNSGILIMSQNANPALYVAYALWCQQQRRPQIVVAALDSVKRTFSIRVCTYEMRNGLAWEQREKLYETMKPFGDIVPLSIPSPDHANSLDVDWGILEVPEVPMQGLAVDVLKVLYSPATV